LKRVPVTKPNENLDIYNKLYKVAPSTHYKNKIAFYDQMIDFEYACTDETRRKTKLLASNPATYDAGIIYGEWKSKSLYRVIQEFTAKNSYGVIYNKKAVAVCNVNYENSRYSVTFLRVVNNNR